MSALAERAVGVELPGEFTPTSLVLSDAIEFEDWSNLLASLVGVGSSVGWWIGDAVNHGERIFGESYAQAIEATGLDYQTIANYAWVASAVEFSTRVENLSWSHHRLVAKLDAHEQRAALARAVGEGYTVREFRDYLRGDEPPAISNPRNEYEDVRARVERLAPLERVSDVASSLLSAAEPLSGRRTAALRAVPVVLLDELEIALGEIPPL